MNEAHALVLMSIHAPGVAIVRQYVSKEAKDAQRLPKLTGLTTVKIGRTSRLDDDLRIDPETSSLRIAIAFVCCGHVPPLELTRMALSSPLPWTLDDDVANGLELSLRTSGDFYETEMADEMANLRGSLLPTP
jgi:hypothetical protein